MSVTAAQPRITVAQAREIATPAATMRTYAAPSGPVPASVAVWRVEMTAGAAGPVHVVSEDQVMVVVEGRIAVDLGDNSHDVGPGEAIVLPAGVERRITAGTDPVVAVVSSLPGATARVGDGEPVRIPWAV